MLDPETGRCSCEYIFGECNTQCSLALFSLQGKGVSYSLALEEAVFVLYSATLKKLKCFSYLSN